MGASWAWPSSPAPRDPRRGAAHLRRSCRRDLGRAGAEERRTRGTKGTFWRQASAGGGSSSSEATEVMSAERGWISEPQQETIWHESHYSREADRIREVGEAQRAA